MLEDRQIVAAQEKITILKNDLRDAREERRKKQEYDLLANIVQELPARLDQERYISTYSLSMIIKYITNFEYRRMVQMKEKLDGLTETKGQLATQIEERKKQFYLLSLTLHELDRMMQG